ncbi:MAG: response regulator FixJ [Xanthobacteraceae bacterium]|jgi:two-component system response regulator FixJ
MPDPVAHVVDDDEAVRNSLAFLLHSAQVAVRTYPSAVVFLEALPTAEPGCIVTDVQMPEIDGIELVKRVRSFAVSMPVIVITGHGDVAVALDAMKAGAADFLEKPFEDEAVLAMVRSALDRRGRESRREAERSGIEQRLAILSDRERRILRGLVGGAPNQAIAYDLGLNPRTVEVHRANIMTKMNASSVSDLLRMTLVAGVFDGRADQARREA